MLYIFRVEEEATDARENRVEGTVIESDYSECSSTADRSATHCRSLAIAVSTICIFL